MRRAGKTTFLHQVRQSWLDRGSQRQQLPFLNFEDERLAGMRGEDLPWFLEDYYRRFPGWRKEETILWCLDEIQVVRLANPLEVL